MNGTGTTTPFSLLNFRVPSVEAPLVLQSSSNCEVNLGLANPGAVSNQPVYYGKRRPEKSRELNNLDVHSSSKKQRKDISNSFEGHVSDEEIENYAQLFFNEFEKFCQIFSPEIYSVYENECDKYSLLILHDFKKLIIHLFNSHYEFLIKIIEKIPLDEVSFVSWQETGRTLFSLIKENPVGKYNLLKVLQEKGVFTFHPTKYAGSYRLTDPSVKEYYFLTKLPIELSLDLILLQKEKFYPSSENEKSVLNYAHKPGFSLKLLLRLLRHPDLPGIHDEACRLQYYQDPIQRSATVFQFFIHEILKGSEHNSFVFQRLSDLFQNFSAEISEKDLSYLLLFFFIYDGSLSHCFPNYENLRAQFKKKLENYSGMQLINLFEQMLQIKMQYYPHICPLFLDYGKKSIVIELITDSADKLSKERETPLDQYDKLFLLVEKNHHFCFAEEKIKKIIEKKGQEKLVESFLALIGQNALFSLNSKFLRELMNKNILTVKRTMFNSSSLDTKLGALFFYLRHQLDIEQACSYMKSRQSLIQVMELDPMPNISAVIRKRVEVFFEDMYQCLRKQTTEQQTLLFLQFFYHSVTDVLFRDYFQSFKCFYNKLCSSIPGFLMGITQKISSTGIPSSSRLSFVLFLFNEKSIPELMSENECRQFYDLNEEILFDYLLQKSERISKTKGLLKTFTHFLLEKDLFSRSLERIFVGNQFFPNLAYILFDKSLVSIRKNYDAFESVFREEKNAQLLLNFIISLPEIDVVNSRIITIFYRMRIVEPLPVPGNHTISWLIENAFLNKLLGFVQDLTNCFQSFPREFFLDQEKNVQYLHIAIKYLNDEYFENFLRHNLILVVDYYRFHWQIEKELSEKPSKMAIMDRMLKDYSC